MFPPLPNRNDHTRQSLIEQTLEIRPMRRQISLAILTAVSALTVVAATPAPAEAAQDRYCLQGRQWGYPGNCQFSTYQQCMATASGTDAYCGINPQYAFAQQRRGAQQYPWY